jgi:hypothetical protein
MLEDMAMRGLRADTQRDYIRFVRSFAAFLRRPPDTATAEDIRRFQVYQAESGVQPPTSNCSVSALRFFFTVTLDRPDLSRRFVLARYPGVRHRTGRKARFAARTVNASGLYSRSSRPGPFDDIGHGVLAEPQFAADQPITAALA